MTKNDLAAQIAKTTGRHQTEVKQIVQLLINGIVETVVSEGRLELRGFGVFKVKHRKARKARNPKTDEVVIVPERASITFRPGKFMLDRVNGLVPPLADGLDDDDLPPEDDADDEDALDTGGEIGYAYGDGNPSDGEADDRIGARD